MRFANCSIYNRSFLLIVDTTISFPLNRFNPLRFFGYLRFTSRYAFMLSFFSSFVINMRCASSSSIGKCFLSIFFLNRFLIAPNPFTFYLNLRSFFSVLMAKQYIMVLFRRKFILNRVHKHFISLDIMFIDKFVNMVFC
jgi:hypothetical protein